MIFSPIDLRSPAAIGITDSHGEFRLTTFSDNDGAVAGEYRIAISKTRLEGITTPKEVDAFIAREHKPPPLPKTIHLLPEKFSVPDKSGLSATVSADKPNDCQFDLR